MCCLLEFESNQFDLMEALLAAPNVVQRGRCGWLLPRINCAESHLYLIHLRGTVPNLVQQERARIFDNLEDLNHGTTYLPLPATSTSKHGVIP